MEDVGQQRGGDVLGLQPVCRLASNGPMRGWCAFFGIKLSVAEFAWLVY